MQVVAVPVHIDAVVQVTPPSDDHSTTYPVIALPLSLPGVHDTVACPLPGTTFTQVSALGALGAGSSEPAVTDEPEGAPLSRVPPAVGLRSARRPGATLPR